MKDKEGTSIHPAVGMKDGEEKLAPGFCGRCNKETTTLWKRTGDALRISCVECSLCYWWFEHRFRS